MKWLNELKTMLTMLFAIAALAGCSKPPEQSSSSPPEKTETQTKAGVTLDANTQARLGLKIETPSIMQWQQEVEGHGRVIDPSALTAAVAALESARLTAELSTREYQRQQSLADQSNVSARSLEAAKSASLHDELALQPALAKFKIDWGPLLAENGSGQKTIADVNAGRVALVRIDLPAGEHLPSPPTRARIVGLSDESKSFDGEFFDTPMGVDQQSQGQGFFFLVQGGELAPGAAVTGFLKISGAPIDGVVIPSSAVLRHEGKGWVYVQSETNQFVRTEIALDRMVTNGWFISENLSATNEIIVTGAQTVLSAELSGGGFGTGERN